MHTLARLAPFLLLGLTTVSTAAPRTSCEPVVTRAWVRMTPAMPMGAGFFSLRNPCRTDVVMTGAATSRFGDVSMHETRVEGGMSRMRPLDRVVVRPGERVEFAPGGRHLMLMKPDARIAVGGTARIELTFADGLRLPADFEIRSAAP